MVVKYNTNSSIPSELFHHGIKGQNWGVRNGPPYPLGSKISTGKRLKKENTNKTESNSSTASTVKKVATAIAIATGVSLAAYGTYKLYNKLGPVYLDRTLNNKDIYTMSLEKFKHKYDYKPERIFASFNKEDVNFYKKHFGKKMLEETEDAFSNTVNGKQAKEIYNIVNTTKNMKVASIKNAEKIFVDEYNTNKLYFKEIVDTWFDGIKKETNGGKDLDWYPRLKEIYKKADNGDIKSMYALFNNIGYTRNDRPGEWVQEKFNEVLKNKGYSAIYDMNDKYNYFNRNSPIIVTNPDAIIQKAVETISKEDISKVTNNINKSDNLRKAYVGAMAAIGGTSTATAGIASIKEKKDGSKKN